jgi:hypothetical protein
MNRGDFGRISGSPSPDAMRGAARQRIKNWGRLAAPPKDSPSAADAAEGSDG